MRFEKFHDEGGQGTERAEHLPERTQGSPAVGWVDDHSYCSTASWEMFEEVDVSEDPDQARRQPQADPKPTPPPPQEAPSLQKGGVTESFFHYSEEWHSGKKLSNELSHPVLIHPNG